MKRIILASTGASGQGGSLLALRYLAEAGHEIHFIYTRWARVNMEKEGLDIEDFAGMARSVSGDANLDSRWASGSNTWDEMILFPCTAGTLAKISGGLGDGLVARAAMVSLKEQRKLSLMLRESPLSPIMLEQALALSRLGVVIGTFSPPYYLRGDVRQEKDTVLELFVRRFLQGRGLISAAGYVPEREAGVEAED